MGGATGGAARGWLRTVTLVCIILVCGDPLVAQADPGRSGDGGMSVIYLVRHAERATDHPRDPTLSDAGGRRAQELARLLADAPLTAVYSTEYRRTVETASPTARHHGLELQFYDPANGGLGRTAEMLRTTPGHHLVVGHSNTTPALVEALGGDPVSGIDEMEYDRLYLVLVSPDGKVTSTLLRFGAPYHAEAGQGAAVAPVAAGPGAAA